MEISGKTKLLCLLGSPVEHSLSPAMHNTAFRIKGIDCSYMAFDVTGDTLSSAVSGLCDIGCMGFNLTMPLKRNIIPLLDEISPVASLCESVNTVKIDDGRLYGTTTDGAGFFSSLKYEEGIDLKDASMVLLGAGGAACAIAAEGAVNHLSSLYIFRRKNPRWQETAEFVDRINSRTSCRASLYDIADETALRAHILKSDILCNATNVGMGTDTSSPVPASVLDKNVPVADIIYYPEITTLMRDAKSIGAKAIGGKYMLLYQGAAAFKIWTGCDMPVPEVKAAVFDATGKEKP